SILGSSDYVSISQINVAQGNSVYEITEGLPYCYSKNASDFIYNIFVDGFENNKWGNWNGYANDSKIVEENPNTGSSSLRIRDNDECSWAESNNFFINIYNFIRGEFFLLAKGFEETIQKFIVEISYDNGITYHQITSFAYSTDFNNDDRDIYSFITPANNQQTAKIRIRIDYPDFGDKTNFDDAELFFDD